MIAACLSLFGLIVTLAVLFARLRALEAEQRHAAARTTGVIIEGNLLAAHVRTLQGRLDSLEGSPVARNGVCHDQ